MKIYISHSSDYDYTNLIYNPIKSSWLMLHHDIFLPHDQDTIIDSKEIIKQQDILIAEVSLPSTGQGIEIGWANSASVPIYSIHKNNAHVSSSLVFVSNKIFTYDNEAEMLAVISSILKDYSSVKAKTGLSQEIKR